MSCGIYMIQNIKNGKLYVGQSIDIETRNKAERCPKATLNRYFKSSVEKYGWENFRFSILEECKKEDLDSREKWYIKLYHSNDSRFGYNATEGGGNNLEHRFRSHSSEEHKKKISESNKGRQRSKESIEKGKESRKQYILKKHTFDIYCLEEDKVYKTVEEVVEKFQCDKNYLLAVLRSKGQRRVKEYHFCRLEDKDTITWHFPNYKDGRGGMKYWKEDTIEKIRQSKLGRIVSEETREKLRIVNAGKTLTEEHKRKIAESQIGKKRKEGTGENISKGKIESRIKNATRKLYCKEIDKSFFRVAEVIEYFKENENVLLEASSIRMNANGRKENYKGFHFSWQPIT